ncbi:MAG: NAD(P)H-dependent oxidoreductase [Magnetospiraceae bacterium]
MKVFIVHAHPEPASFTTAMKETAQAVLEGAGHSVTVSDLYAMAWNPVASAADFGGRRNADYLVYALEQRHGWENQTLAEDIRAEVEKLLAADLVILSFPVYWFSVPAILKGWIDRVLISGVCYGGKRIYDRGGLVGKKALVACTLGGRQDMFGPGAVHGDLNALLSPILRGTLAYVGMDVLAPFCGHHVPYVTPEARAEILAVYTQRLLHVETETPLSMPSLDDFDDRLRPK